MAQVKATTRQELLRLKKNLLQVKFAYKLLEQKRDTLVQEFLKLKEEFFKKKKDIYEKTREIILLLEFSEKFHSVSLLDYLSAIPTATIELKESAFSVMGLRSKIFLVEKLKKPQVDKNLCPESFYAAIRKFEKIIPEFIQLSSLENILEKLAAAIEKTRRRVNYLKDIIIPLLQSQIKYLNQKLSDQERERFVFNLKLKKKKTNK